jgi:hypothetical protein
MADCNTIDARLAAARKAYDELMTGQMVSRIVDQNGESVSYSKVSINSLLSYISQLENEKAQCTGSAFAQYRGPIRFLFGRRTPR